MDNNPKETARKLRQAGYSLDQIVKKIGFARSTVYYWISRVPLTPQQLLDLKTKRIEARKLGGIARRNQRLSDIKRHTKQALKDIKEIVNRDLFLIGVALYWAEGTKQNGRDVSCPLEFCNQDPKMMLLFSKWLDLIGISREVRQYTLYIHKQYQPFDKQIKSAWENKLNDYIKKWERTILKKHQTNRRISADYLGLIKIRIIKSADLNRKVSGWINAINSLT